MAEESSRTKEEYIYRSHDAQLNSFPLLNVLCHIKYTFFGSLNLIACISAVISTELLTQFSEVLVR